MHFCPKCGNMFYLRLIKDEETDDDLLIYYCRNCGHEDKSLSTNMNNLYVSKTDIEVTASYKNKINKYTKLDPTLPRINTIDCPNSECACNKMIESKDGSYPEQEKEILYIRYDDKNMKYVYLCAICDTVWETK